MSPADIEETFSYYVKQIKSLYPNLAYLHVVEGRIDGNVDTAELESESLDFLVSFLSSGALLNVIAYLAFFIAEKNLGIITFPRSRIFQGRKRNRWSWKIR